MRPAAVAAPGRGIDGRQGDAINRLVGLGRTTCLKIEGQPGATELAVLGAFASAQGQLSWPRSIQGL